MDKLELYVEKSNSRKVTMFYGVVTTAIFIAQTDGDKKNYQLALYNGSIRVCIYSFNYFPDTLLNQVTESKVDLHYYDQAQLSLEDQQDLMNQNLKK